MIWNQCRRRGWIQKTRRYAHSKTSAVQVSISKSLLIAMRQRNLFTSSGLHHTVYLTMGRAETRGGVAMTGFLLYTAF